MSRVARGVTCDLPLRCRTERQPTEKLRTAAAAAGGLVRTGQIAAALNDGATTTEVARVRHPAGLNAGSASPAGTVVSNALNVAELAVRQCVKIVTAG